MALHPGFTQLAQTSALDTRLGEMAWVVRNADGSPRLGVLWDAALNAGLVQTTATTGTMTLALPVSSFIVSRGTFDGIAKITNDGSITTPIATAPTSGQTRRDVVYVKQNDSLQGDANDFAVFAVATGTAATTGTQTEPAIPTGALKLATLDIPGGATSTQSAGVVLTQTFQYTGPTGGIIPMRSLAELKTWSPENGTYARSVSVGSNVVYVYDAGAAAWHPLNATIHSSSASNGNTLNSSATATELQLTSSLQYTGDNDIIGNAGAHPVAQIAGWYRITACVNWQAGSTGIRSFEVRVNGASLQQVCGATNAAVPSPTQTWQSVSTIIQLSAGDYIGVFGAQTQGSALQYQVSLQVELVR